MSRGILGARFARRCRGACPSLARAAPALLTFGAAALASEAALSFAAGGAGVAGRHRRPECRPHAACRSTALQLVLARGCPERGRLPAAPLAGGSLRSWHGEGVQRRTPLGAVQSSGPFLVFEELKETKPKKRTKRRRGKLWIFEDGEWVRVHPDVPPEKAGAETVPSEDPRELTRQIQGSKQARRLFAFLEAAVRAPAFGAGHAALVLEVLAAQRCTLRKADLAGLRDRHELGALAARGKELLEAPASAGNVSAGLAARALRGLAIYRAHAPQLQALAAPLAAHAVRTIAEMDSKQVATLVWAVAELREFAPELQDTLLPALVDQDRLLRARRYVQRSAPQEYASMEMGLFKLRKEVPFLRSVLPA